jgi:prepilin-type N-terminal cleavage/methylation domain-containing protein
MSQLRAVLRDQRGFTLTELLVVAAVLGMILAGVVLIHMQGQQAYLFGSHRVEVQQNNRAALELMVRELRSAQSVTALASASNLTFVDLNGVIVQYQLSGTTLNRITGGTTTPLIGGVQTLAMTYYRYDPATNTTPVTTVPASVQLVRVQLVTGTEDYAGAGSPANQHATMESLVRLRNIP